MFAHLENAGLPGVVAKERILVIGRSDAPSPTDPETVAINSIATGVIAEGFCRAEEWIASGLVGFHVGLAHAHVFAQAVGKLPHLGAGIAIADGGDPVVIVATVHGAGQSHLFEAVAARNGNRTVAGGCQRRQQHGSQHCDDCDYHEQLDQGE